jgi:hypothetical protein
MQTLTFTPEGFLTPFEKINVDLATFERTFVTDFPNSETRKTLFDNYLRYIDSFSKEITPNFTQWIDGSFVTQKENPNDIDLVTLIEVAIHDEKEHLIDEKYISSVTYELGLDAYVMKIYPTTEDAYETYTLFHSEIWYNRFCRTRKNIINDTFSKGFLEIKYESYGK